MRDGPFSVRRRFVIEALRALREYCRECKAEPLTRTGTCTLAQGQRQQTNTNTNSH